MNTNATKIKTMLTSADAELITQGIELLLALADQSVVDDLLQGVSWHAPEQKNHYHAVITEVNRLILAAAAGRVGHASTQGVLELEFTPEWRIEQSQTDLLADVARWPDLQKIKINLMPRTKLDVSVLRAVPGLRELRLRCSTGVSSDLITGIESLDQLEIFYTPKTTAPRACFAPGARRPQAGLPHTVVVDQKTNDLGNITDVPDIKGVVISEHYRPISLAPLAKMADLRFLDVRKSRGITDVSELSGHPELRIIAAYESGIDINTVPEDLIPLVSFAKNPKLSFDRKRPKPAMATSSKKPTAKRSNKKAKITDHEGWPAVEAGLSARQSDDVLDAADRVVELGPAAIEHVLSRIVVGKKGYLTGRPPVRLGDRLLLPTLAGRLMRAAPADSVQANRLRDVSQLVIQGTSWYGTPPDFVHLDEFSQLRELLVTHIGSTHFDFSDVSGLESLTLSVRLGCELEVPPSLKRLMVARGHIKNPESLSESNIEELVVLDFWDAGPMAEVFRGKSLKRASIRGQAAIEAIADCPIEELETQARYLEPLVGHPTLKQLIVEPGTTSQVPAKLQHLVIERDQTAPDAWMWEL